MLKSPVNICVHSANLFSLHHFQACLDASFFLGAAQKQMRIKNSHRLTGWQLHFDVLDNAHPGIARLELAAYVYLTGFPAPPVARTLPTPATKALRSRHHSAHNRHGENGENCAT